MKAPELIITPELIESLRRSQAQLASGDVYTLEEALAAFDEGVEEGSLQRAQLKQEKRSQRASANT